MEIVESKNYQKRVVIVGAGFAGLTLAKKLSPKHFQVVLLDKNNYHQFQPLLYQVATGGLDAGSISFPLRKVFHKKKNVFIRIAEVKEVQPEKNILVTTIGEISYDYLVLAHGAETNYFGMQDVQQHAFSMKSISEALLLRNTLLQNYEQALNTNSNHERSALLNIVVVGGGPTGVELAGAIAEMKNKILPRDYPELNISQMKISLVEAAPRLLNGMSEELGMKVEEYLGSLGVKVITHSSVSKYDGESVILKDGKTLYSRCVIWAAGVKGTKMMGLPASALLPNHRVIVDGYNKVKGLENVYAIGDVSTMPGGKFPKGHPQVAPVAMQQATLLAENLGRIENNNQLKTFEYRDKGSMATVGRNLAVVQVGRIKVKGFIAWLTWMMVHLLSIIGVKNRLIILINWIWQYVTYDQALRLIIRPSERKVKNNMHEKVVGTTLVHNQLASLPT
ncbi:MAG: NAD(P)/FAD-dependent oxidoreductase [Candidatus Dadabacteria bacterium]